MSKREERIQTIATGLLISRMSPVDAITQAALFVQLCETRSAAEAEAEATPEPEEDPEVELYVNAVKELVPWAERGIIINLRYNAYSPAGAAEWLKSYSLYLRTNNEQ